MTDRRYWPCRPAFPNELKALFEQLATCAVASTFGALATGCAASRPVNGDANAGGGLPPDPPGEWQPLQCEETTGTLKLEPLGRINPTKPVDYVAALRTARALDHDAIYVSAVAAHGTPCANADDATACEAQVTAIKTPPAECGCDPSLLVTDAQGARRLTQPSEYLALAGTIDTSAEAVLAAFLAGQHLACGNTGLNTGQPGTRVRDAGADYEVFSQWESCGAGVFKQTTAISPDGTVRVGTAEKIDESHCVIGRRPEGLAFAAPLSAHSALGEYFACSARLEAASVFAFERMVRELRALDAPPDLVQRCAQAALEEIEHTRITTGLARRFGAEPALPAWSELPVRSALAIAVENAVEGCVRETLGALIAHCQAAAAQDSGVRQAMAVIAGDETRHAELSWMVARWLEPQLSADEQLSVAAARVAALHQLASQADLELGSAERGAIGWPSREVQAALLGRLSDAHRA